MLAVSYEIEDGVRGSPEADTREDAGLGVYPGKDMNLILRREGEDSNVLRTGSSNKTRGVIRAAQNKSLARDPGGDGQHGDLQVVRWDDGEVVD